MPQAAMSRMKPGSAIVDMAVEIARAYVFLASPRCSSYTTGEILPLSGG